MNAFIKDSIKHFFKEIEEHSTKTKRDDKYHIIEYGELGLVNFFINGIVRHDTDHRFLIMNEFELEDRNENYGGRVDIMIEDNQENVIYFIEAKRVYSQENEPETDEWNKDLTNKYYNEVLSQANKYFKADFHNLKRFSGAYNIALVFNTTKFSNNSRIKSWEKYKPTKDEFYEFGKFRSSSLTNWLGLACYGTIKTLEI